MHISVEGACRSTSGNDIRAIITFHDTDRTGKTLRRSLGLKARPGAKTRFTILFGNEPDCVWPFKPRLCPHRVGLGHLGTFATAVLLHSRKHEADSLQTKYVVEILEA